MGAGHYANTPQSLIVPSKTSPGPLYHAYVCRNNTNPPESMNDQGMERVCAQPVGLVCSPGLLVSVALIIPEVGGTSRSHSHLNSVLISTHLLTHVFFPSLLWPCVSVAVITFRFATVTSLLSCKSCHAVQELGQIKMWTLHSTWYETEVRAKVLIVAHSNTLTLLAPPPHTHCPQLCHTQQLNRYALDARTAMGSHTWYGACRGCC